MNIGKSEIRLWIFAGIVALAAIGFAKAEDAPVSKADGYRGIWYMNQASHDEYKYKYSGGFATYPQQHIPIAYYCKEVNKTFFCYGGSASPDNQGKRDLLHMVSYYDHATGKVPRPVVLLDKHTDDAHDNPTLMVDDSGFIWIFSPTHGVGRPSYIHRSKKPFSIEGFERIVTTNFSYPQPWWLPGQGFLFLHTRYAEGRNLFWMTSKDGVQWEAGHRLSKMEMGDYQISWRDGARLVTAFDFHPTPLGLNGRANIYYLETRDMGRTWTTADGKAVEVPLKQTNNPALIFDSRAKGLLVYLKDIAFDAQKNPVILFLTSKGYQSGPKNDPRQWQTARWTGTNWEFKPFTQSHNNYDHGSLYIEADGTWRIIAPTETGPQPYNPGGEVVMWTSNDKGSTWSRMKQLTEHSKLNQTYVRKPVNAQPDFYALWADGDARQPSACHMYFTNQKGDHVWKLPEKMSEEMEAPEIVK